MPQLIVENLAKRYAGAKALDGVSFQVEEGEFFTLLGPSGCGKSTTLSIIAGLQRPDAGVVRLGDTVFVDQSSGRFLLPEERMLGVVFQSYALWPQMTVEENLAFPLKLRRVPSRQRGALVADTLEKVGLLPMLKRYPHQLSGGQQQRVALARALVYAPRVLLLDEPLSNLDAKLRDQARDWLKQVQADTGITTIYVTHDQLEALSLSDRIAVMREGRALQVGSPVEIYERPVSPAVARFVGRCNFFSGDVADGHGARTLIKLNGTGITLAAEDENSWASGTAVTMGVRSEKVELVAKAHHELSDNELPARVLRSAYVGARFECVLDVAGVTVHAETDTVPGDGEVALRVPPDACMVFAREGATVDAKERDLSPSLG